jgi:hypothetical protein
VIRACEQQLRRVLPPYPICLLALSLVMGALLLEILLSRLIYGEWVNPFAISEELNPHLHQGILPFIAFGYGLWRVAAFHPCYRPRYREWLKTVAWNPHLPLPLGSPIFGWRDGVVLVTIAAMAGSWQWGLASSAAMLGAWSVMLIAANYAAGFDALVLAGSLALLPTVLSEFHPWLGSMTLLAYLISIMGVKPSLQLFPWESMPRWDALSASQREKTGRPSDAWPLLGTCRYGGVPVGITMPHALMLATLAAAAAATFTLKFELDAVARGFRRGSGETDLMHLLISSCLLMCGVRLLLYCGTCRPPISLAGRLATRRFIIPSYDQIFVAPLLVLLIGMGGPRILWHWEANDSLTAGIAMFAMVAVALGMGPNFSRWQLTGNHRIVVRRPAGSRQFTKSRGTA